MSLNVPCSSVPRNKLPRDNVPRKEDGSPDDQNQGDRGARIVANDHLDDPASYVPLILVIVGHLQKGQSQRRIFGPKRPNMAGSSVFLGGPKGPKWPKMVNLTVIHCENQN